MKAALLTSALAGSLLLTAYAQQPASHLTATSVNVSEPGSSVRIDITRWSTDQEREQLVDSMNPPPAPAPAEAAEGRGGARGARGGAGARGARGGAGGRGGRGGGGNAPFDPISSLTTALGKAQTIGYIWTNEVTGYSIKYAQRVPSTDGSERIILATDRRLGANSLSWTPASGVLTDYAFTVLELHLKSNGPGEGKTSLTAPIVVDKENGTIGLEDYAAAPALLTNVAHRQARP